MVRYGICGENAIVPSHGVAHYPENLSLAEGASIWMPYMTAYSVLVHYGKLKKGYAVLIPAARNSVGLDAIQIFKAARGHGYRGYRPPSCRASSILIPRVRFRPLADH
jgi:NADPH:quinone reductase-like Zn-dependent oxidoreductase